MKFIASITLTAAILAAAGQPQTFRGVITDTMCGKTHEMVKGQPDDKCISMCLKGTSSRYALYDGSRVFNLSDQKLPAKFPARHVLVTGTLDEKSRTIKVSAIEAEPDTK